jgi:nucleoside-diphosphate-sugar epimerase
MDELKGKTILVTGATGLIGSRIVETLMNMGGVNVIANSRNEQKLKKLFAVYTGQKNFKCLSQDISEPIMLLQPVHVIFHAASPITRKIIAEKPLDVIKPNLIATQNLLELLVKQRIETQINGRIVIFSSATVYGNNTADDIKVSENDTFIAADALESNNAPYSESKRMLEVLTRAFIRQFGVDAVIARISYVYGKPPFPDLSLAMYEFLNDALAEKDIILQRSGFPRRDNIYVDDVVSGLFAMLLKGSTGEAYNISTSGELGSFSAIDEIAEMIASIVNEDLKIKIQVVYQIGKSTMRKPGIILDNSKLKQLMWAPKTGLKEGIRMLTPPPPHTPRCLFI